MNAIMIAQSGIRNQQALCQYWHNSVQRKPVWAIFSDKHGMISWACGKSNARKLLNALSEQLGEFLWLVKISA